MDRNKLFRILFRVTYFLWKLYGILPLRYDFRVNKFENSRRSVYYSVVIMLAYSTGMAYVYWRAANFYQRHSPSGTAYFSWAQFTLNYCFLVVTIVIAILCRNHTKNLLNVFIMLATILIRQSRVQNDYKLLKKYLCKLVFVDFCMKLAICGSFYTYGGRGFIGFLTGLNFVFMWSMEVFCNGFVAMCYFAAHLYRLINLQVNESVQKLCDFELDQSYWLLHPSEKKQICYRVAASLDKLAYLHQDVTTVLKKFVKQLDYSLLMTIIWCFLITISGTFFAYTSLVQDLRDNVRPPLLKYAHAFGLSVFQALQFYYIVSASALLTKRAEKTGLVVNRFFKAEIDERVERTIDMFSMALLHQSYSVENFGMFKVDFTLMYSMVGTITSYLIIMVQFQLSEL
ncbi:uncharacterized protein LOC131681112 [Topomyia yanbarensis]|uniref:uncharacterized protein LOC131681112 n=1 Tax=Topomyia yanbarensis TaxID=2498891 RepID=UPI00273B821F|nr:uncharacterized protein LOC131681112 [Topomyia yanbarensis]